MSEKEITKEEQEKINKHIEEFWREYVRSPYN